MELLFAAVSPDCVVLEPTNMKISSYPSVAMQQLLSLTKHFTSPNDLKTFQMYSRAIDAGVLLNLKLFSVSRNTGWL
jgi:hypothetical protein